MLSFFCLAILKVLDEEDHQEGNNSGACIDDELPGIREMTYRAKECPE